MNNQTNIYFTTINTDNTCIEKEITDFIVSDNNIAKDICNSVDKYKFLINNLSIDSKVVSFMIKIIMNTKIIYNQMFNFKNKDNIVTPTSNTVFVYNETLEIFTKLWIYIPKTIFDVLDKVVEPIIEKTVELQLICEKPVEVQIIEKPVELQIINETVESQNINEPEEVQPFFEKSVELQNIEKQVEAQIINEPVEVQNIEKPVEAQNINKQDDVQQLNEKLVEQQIKEEDVYIDMPGLIKLEEPTVASD